MNVFDPVSTIMSTDLIVLEPTASIADAAALFDSNKIHHILIAIDHKLIGVVSKSDFLFFRRGFLQKSEDLRIDQIRMNNYEVNYIMVTEVVTLSKESTIIEALDIYKENTIYAIPVMDNNMLVGIVTTHDIIKLLISENARNVPVQ